MRYFIIGFKNSGKTTFGSKLAQKLGIRFIDLDEYIEHQEGKTIPQIYTALGEEKFRTLEWQSLKKLAKTEDHVVIATGGGAPCNCDNMNLMEKYGEVIYLKVPDEILVGRLLQASLSRPIVFGKSETEIRNYLADLKNRCEHHYMKATHIVEGINPEPDELISRLGKQTG